MNSASAIRLQIETALADRIPSALTLAQKVIHPVAATGVAAVDELLQGGLPVGAITEMVGPESSGRTSLALSFLAGLTQAAKVGAWVDVSNTLHPESAAAAGVDLSRLLWVRCGIPNVAVAAQAAQNGLALSEKYLVPAPVGKGLCRKSTSKPWPRIEQALRTTDLILQAGGFSAIVLDLASIAPEYVSRVPLATWFRYRAAAERTRASILLLTQHSCAKSSAELLLRFHAGQARRNECTVFTGIEHRMEVARRRFTEAPANIVPLRKPQQSATTASWRSRTTWAGPRSVLE